MRWEAETPGTLRVTFETDDPKLVRLLNAIAEYPAHMPCRHEMEAQLYRHLEKKALREAERLVVRRHELHGIV